jgi:hypothetical protein
MAAVDGQRRRPPPYVLYPLSFLCFLSGPNLIAAFIISTGIDLLNYWGQPFEKKGIKVGKS